MTIEKTEQLTQAFHLFNELTQNLNESYQGLEAQVAKLHQQLAVANNDRLKTLVEKEQLTNRLHKLLATLPAGVMVLDANNKIIDCNQVVINFFGLSPMGIRWPTLVDEQLIPVANNPHEWLLRDGRRVSLMRSALGNNQGQIILLTDVTEMRSLQDLVNQQESLSAMGEMVASMAHQVRTPLSTAILYASQLGDKNISEHKRQRFSQKILERLHFLESQVNDMLIFAKDGRLAMEEFSLATLLGKISEVMQEQTLNSEISFTLMNKSQVTTMQGNENALCGAMMNILNNAQQAIEGKGEIQLLAEQSENNLKIVIKDNGSGISSSDQERLFEPFYTTRTSGTGLGLAVAESVMRAHGGNVSCNSELGKGTEFILNLPSTCQNFLPNASSAHSKL